MKVRTGVICEFVKEASFSPEIRSLLFFNLDSKTKFCPTIWFVIFLSDAVWYGVL